MSQWFIPLHYLLTVVIKPDPTTTSTGLTHSATQRSGNTTIIIIIAVGSLSANYAKIMLARSRSGSPQLALRFQLTLGHARKIVSRASLISPDTLHQLQK